MIRSMTGFAALTREAEVARVHVTAKSVNHRFLDVLVKAPSALGSVEGRLKALAQQRLGRGRLELTVAIEQTAPPERQVSLDEHLLDQISRAFEDAKMKGLVTGNLTIADVLRLPQVVDIRPADAQPPGVAPAGLAELVEGAVADALEALVRMRETEGRMLADDLDHRLAVLAGLIDDLERLAREGQAQLESRLRERLEALPAELRGDPSAVAQETVRFVARSDIDEEIVRLRGHVQHWRALAAADEPCGRKLDFLVQEMNREINTIGSKAEGGEAAEAVIAAKAELERLREQIQNVE